MAKRTPHDSVYSCAADAIQSARRVVVKIGSSLIVDNDLSLDENWLGAVISDLNELRDRGVETIVVTSGAIALGRRQLGLRGPLRLDQSQAASAAGQTLLINGWQRAFDAHGIKVAQLLLTLADTEHRRRYLNARATISALLELGVVPIINENDTVATNEIRYGDNDRLAAHTSQLADADVLLILSDVDGLYTANPQTSDDAKHIPVVEAITPQIEAMASGPNTEASIGKGGMVTKISAARIAGASGCATIIAPGKIDRPVTSICDGGRATLFLPSADREAARKTWIRNLQKPSGVLTIDHGAAAALQQGASLLPAGIKNVSGEFERGDVLDVESQTGAMIARGLAAYDAPDMKLIAGKRSDAVFEILGVRQRAAAIDRDNLVLNK
ncbi:MAG: glutamate 5-kinase [Pseudomonadota bacterium]